MYTEREQQFVKPCFTSCLHPHCVGVSSQGHAGCGEKLFCQLEVLVLPQEHWKALNSQRLTALF